MFINKVTNACVPHTKIRLPPVTYTYSLSKTKETSEFYTLLNTQYTVCCGYNWSFRK